MDVCVCYTCCSAFMFCFMYVFVPLYSAYECLNQSTSITTKKAFLIEFEIDFRNQAYMFHWQSKMFGNVWLSLHKPQRMTMTGDVNPFELYSEGPGGSACNCMLVLIFSLLKDQCVGFSFI